MLYCRVDEILASRSVLSKAIYSGKCRYYFAINISFSEAVGEVLSFNGCNSPTVFDLVYVAGISFTFIVQLWDINLLLEVPTTLLLKTTPSVLRASTSESLKLVTSSYFLFFPSFIILCNNVIVSSQVCALKCSGFFPHWDLRMLNVWMQCCRYQ